MNTLGRGSVIATIALIALSGCAAEVPAPTAAPSLMPTASPEPEPISKPTPLIDLSCDELVSHDQLAALSTTTLTRVDAFFTDPQQAGLYGIPVHYPLRQLQGTACYWNDGASENDPAHASFSLFLLPDAESAWARYVEYDGYFTGRGPSCSDPARYGVSSCSWSGITADGTWIDVEYDGMKDFGSAEANLAQFNSLLDSVVDQVTGAPHGPVWVAPANTIPVPVGCPGVLSKEILGNALNMAPDAFSFYAGPGGATSFLYEAQVEIGAEWCSKWTAKTATETSENPDFAVLRGGEWAWEDAREVNPNFASAQPLALTGLVEGDSAWTREGNGPIVDLIIGGNWISMATYDVELAAHGVGREALTVMAQGIVDALRD